MTREGAEAALARFVSDALPQFGTYQDAMLRGERFLFHSVLSLYINCGLLDPLHVCRQVEAAYRRGRVSINAAVGFIRQIIGWREYVRGVYWLNMPDYRSRNHFGHNRALPSFYWTGVTKMECLRAAITQTKNKIGKALMVPSLRNMLAQPSSTVTFRRLMDEGAIVICNLSKGSLGESTAHLLGALITTALAQAALSRADTAAGDRRVFHLYADEFQSFATESFALILSEARKYALTLTIGHQYLDQVPDQLRSAVFGNAGSIVSCRAGAEDAAILSRQIGLGGPDALLALPNFTAWARLLRRGVPTSPIRIRLYDAPRPRRPDPHRLILTSRMRFGRPRAEVEARISKFLGA